ncbi:MAG: hypothetical protein KDD50_13960 [Bdellovibrionales bacterium]|nr:hypothetical protein [Bdellovibrionales bacterium]
MGKKKIFIKLAMVLEFLFSAEGAQATLRCPYTEIENAKKICHVLLKPGDPSHFYLILHKGYEELSGLKKFSFFSYQEQKKHSYQVRLRFDRLPREDYLKLRLELKIDFVDLLAIQLINLRSYEERMQLAANYQKESHLKAYLNGNQKRREQAILKILKKELAQKYFSWEKSSSYAKKVLSSLYSL